jgi:hypothetical protein
MSKPLSDVTLADGERRLANKHDLMVEPSALPIWQCRLG